MSYSKVTRTYDTGETAWATGFALGQLDVSHIRVRVNNEQDGLGNPIYREFTYNPDNGYVSFDPTGLVDGDKIHIERVTPINQMEVDFAGGADLTRANFDRSAKQTLMAVQELADNFEDTVTTVEELVSEVEGLLGETSAFARAVPGGAEFGRVGDVVMTTRTDGVYVGGFRIMHLHFGSRNLYETATIPVWAKNWTIEFGGRTLAYQRDDTGSAAVSANGVKCSPIEAATPAHWGVAQNTDETTKLHAMIDWCTANGHELNWPDGKTYMMSRYNNAGTNINVNWTCTGTCKLISTDTTPLGFGDPTGFEDDYFIRFAGTTVRTTQVASTTAVGSKIIPVLSTTDVVAGKHVVLINTTKMIDTDHRGQNREGFQALVTRVISGTQVEIEVPIDRQITIGTTAGTITAVDSATVLTTNLVAQDVSSMRYRMRMTSGSANGQTANIIGYDPATGKITCHNENGMFPTGIVNGDTFNIEREATVLFSSAVTGSITGNLEITRPTTLNATPGDFGFRGLVLARSLNYWINGLRMSGFSEAGVRIISSVRGVFENIVVQDANRAYDGTDGTGYGVSVHQSSHGVFRNISGFGCRRTLDVSGTQGSSWHVVTENITGTGGGRAYDGVMFFPAGATESSVCGSHGNAFHTRYINTEGTDVHGVLNCRGRDEVARGIHGAGAMQYLLNLFHGGGITASELTYDDRFSEIGDTTATQNDATTQRESRLSFVVQLDVGNWHMDRPTVIRDVVAKGVRRGLFGFRGNGNADNIHFSEYDITVADNDVNFAKLRTVSGFTTTYGDGIVDGGGIIRQHDGYVFPGAPVVQRHFNSRAEFAAARIPLWVNYWTVLHAGIVLHYKRDTLGTALTSANGVKGSPSGLVHAEHFGAVRDGTTDDRTAILAALAYTAGSGERGSLLQGVYATSGELRIPAGARWEGSGNWSAVSSISNIPDRTTTIKYTGEANPAIAVLNFSTYDVGVEGSAAGQLENVSFTNVTVDAGLAGYGVYCNRSWSQNDFSYITVTGSTEHGFWAGNCWNGTMNNWVSYKTRGCGITLGVNTFGWAQCAVDESVCNSFFGYYAGIDRGVSGISTIRLNAANELSDAGLALEAGITIGSTRGTVFNNAQGSQCGGFGILLVEGYQIPLLLRGGYVEGNGQSSGFTTRDWDFGVNCTDVRLSTTVRGMHFGLRTTGGIRIWGDPNTYKPEMMVDFSDCGFLPPILATHGYYKLTNAPPETVFLGEHPRQVGPSYNGHRGLVPVARTLIETSAGVSTLASNSGIITSVTYVSTGIYTVTFHADNYQADTDYLVMVTGGDQRLYGVQNKNTFGFQITQRGITGTLADTNTAPISVVVYADVPAV